MTEDEMKAFLAPVEALEVERVEADLKAAFGAFAPLKRLTETVTCYSLERPPVDMVTDVEGWDILGGVHIGRHILPSEGSPVDEPEGDGPREHRQALIDIVRAAFEAGRKYDVAVAGRAA